MLKKSTWVVALGSNSMTASGTTASPIGLIEASAAVQHSNTEDRYEIDSDKLLSCFKAFGAPLYVIVLIHSFELNATVTINTGFCLAAPLKRSRSEPVISAC